jgi:hypothetical protein
MRGTWTTTAATALATLAVAGAAHAQLPGTAQIGAAQGYGTSSQTIVTCPTGSCIAVQASAPSDASYASPYGGTITEWAANLNGNGTAALVVLRPVAGQAATFSILSSSTPRSVFAPQGNTYVFETAQAVQPGDMVGIALTGTAGLLTTATTTGGAIGTGQSSATGTVDVTPGATNLALWFRATVARTPSVTGISPASGPAAGGASVTIAGQNLDTVTGVAFGSTPAASFVINGFDSITAVAPAGSGSVPVTVSGSTGSATSAAPFSYSAAPAPAPTPTPTPTPTPSPVARCEVPDLAGKTLRRARRALGQADCRTGEVTRQPSRGDDGRPRVVAQSPSAGAVRRAGTRVNITLGFPRRG